MELIRMTRGFRNNNPGNIRNTSIDWKGETVGDDKGFETFKAVEYGIRAIFRLLKTYRSKGFDSIREIIYRFAPPSENQTDQYVLSVMHYMSEHDDNARKLLEEEGEHLKPYPYGLIELFVEAIIHHENGSQPFNREFIEGCSKL